MIRVVGGLYRSRNLLTPDTDATKPTKDITRTGIFNALAFDVDSANCLDLFAGSGALGIEAISRGANNVMFCDINALAFKTINQNLKNLNIDTHRYDVFLSDYKTCLESLKKSSIDIVFLDPPYKDDIYKDIVNYLLSNGILSNRGIIVCECDHELDFSSFEFAKVKMYKYGYSKVYILRK